MPFCFICPYFRIHVLLSVLTYFTLVYVTALAKPRGADASVVLFKKFKKRMHLYLLNKCVNTLGIYLLFLGNDDNAY